MARKPKYKPSFAKKLRDGLRLTPRRITQVGDNVVRHGWTIDWICIEWGITEKTYYNWVEEYTTFREAHEIGQVHFRAFLEEEYDLAMYNKDVNGGLMKFKMQNVNNWSDKKQVEASTKHEEIRTVNINRIDSTKRLEEKESNIIDITPIHEEHTNKLN